MQDNRDYTRTLNVSNFLEVTNFILLTHSRFEIPIQPIDDFYDHSIYLL